MMVEPNSLPVVAEFIEKFGFQLTFTGVVAYLLYSHLTKANQKLEVTQEKMANELRLQIKELKQESKADKKMFQDTVKEFARSIDEFAVVRTEIREIKQDIKELKEKD